MAMRERQQWNMVPQRSTTLVVVCAISASQICLLCPAEVTKVGGCTIYVTSFKVEQCPPQFQPCCTLQYYVIDEQLNLLFQQCVLTSESSTLFTKVQQRLEM